MEMHRLAHNLLDMLDPARLMVRAGYLPDPWQRSVLRNRAPRQLWCCGRQTGKSLTVGALAVYEATTRPDALILIVSPSLRQSSEAFRKVMTIFNAVGRPVAVTHESALRIELANGSRVVSLPESEDTVRGFSNVALVAIDEAARVSGDLYAAVRPMLATSEGRLVALSTPAGKRGWFWRAWSEESEWVRMEVPASQCPRIAAEFLASERQALGRRWFAQEYECAFNADERQVFSPEVIARAQATGVVPLAADPEWASLLASMEQR
jgi:hypothetical protein